MHTDRQTGQGGEMGGYRRTDGEGREVDGYRQTYRVDR